MVEDFLQQTRQRLRHARHSSALFEPGACTSLNLGFSQRCWLFQCPRKHWSTTKRAASPNNLRRRGTREQSNNTSRHTGPTSGAAEAVQLHLARKERHKGAADCLCDNGNCCCWQRSARRVGAGDSGCSPPAASRAVLSQGCPTPEHCFSTVRAGCYAKHIWAASAPSRAALFSHVPVLSRTMGWNLTPCAAQCP